jgi:hypothetical protein
LKFYTLVTGKDYSSELDFPTVLEDNKKDKATIMIPLPSRGFKNLQAKLAEALATVQLIQVESSTWGSLPVDINYDKSDFNHLQDFGYWQPAVRKDDFFNVTESHTPYHVLAGRKAYRSQRL